MPITQNLIYSLIERPVVFNVLVRHSIFVSTYQIINIYILKKFYHYWSRRNILPKRLIQGCLGTMLCNIFNSYLYNAFLKLLFKHLAYKGIMIEIIYSLLKSFNKYA